MRCLLLNDARLVTLAGSQTVRSLQRLSYQISLYCQPFHHRSFPGVMSDRAAVEG